MPAKKQTHKTSEKQARDHYAPLQEKLKQKNWDPIKEILEITDEYEQGTPKREPGKDYWGACCLESQDVDAPQKAHMPDGTVSSPEAVKKITKQTKKTK